MKTNIALVGFMGAGKSAVGELLAKRLKLQFVETDALIEAREVRSIASIFAENGEAYFRSCEAEIIAQVSGMAGTVISCGGGAVLDRCNVEHLRTSAVIIYLQAEPEVILRRLSGCADTRPLLSVDDPSSTVANMLKQRSPLYERAADIILDTSRLSVQEVADAIEKSLERYESTAVIE